LSSSACFIVLITCPPSFFVQRGQRQADRHALRLFEFDQMLDRLEFVGMIRVLGEPLIDQDRDRLRIGRFFLGQRHGTARLDSYHGRLRFFQHPIGDLAERGLAAQRLRGSAHHNEIDLLRLFEDGLRRIGGGGRAHLHFRQILQRLRQPAEGHIRFHGVLRGQMQRHQVVWLCTQTYPQGQFGVRATAHGNQHMLDLFWQGTAHQGYITRRTRQHFGGSDAQRVELARPVQQQQIRFVGGDGFRQVGPRLM
jgi:hypothetical protein